MREFFFFAAFAVIVQGVTISRVKTFVFRILTDAARSNCSWVGFFLTWHPKLSTYQSEFRGRWDSADKAENIIDLNGLSQISSRFLSRNSLFLSEYTPVIKLYRSTNGTANFFLVSSSSLPRTLPGSSFLRASLACLTLVPCILISLKSFPAFRSLFRSTFRLILRGGIIRWGLGFASLFFR